MSVEDRFRKLYEDLTTLDISELEQLYSEDIEFIDPVAIHHGIESVKHYFAGLLASTQSCKFTIHHLLSQTAHEKFNYDLVVEWTMHLQLKDKTNVICVDGVSMLRVKEDLICYHRDYYDLGEMVYEQVPVLSSVIRFIKKKLNS